jgi:hypothetical protein
MIKKIIPIVLMFYSMFSYGQVKHPFALGFNFHPVIGDSYEFIGEYKLNYHWTISGKFGYAGKATYGRWNDLVYEVGLKDATTSGCFSKLGVKYYFFNNTVFVLANVILSQYKNTGTYTDTSNVATYKKHTGTRWAFGLTHGYRVKIKRDRLFLDIGFQMGFAERMKVRPIGRNYYQPGLGSELSYSMFLQLMLSLMVAF